MAWMRREAACRRMHGGGTSTTVSIQYFALRPLATPPFLFPTWHVRQVTQTQQDPAQVKAVSGSAAWEIISRMKNKHKRGLQTAYLMLFTLPHIPLSQ